MREIKTLGPDVADSPPRRSPTLTVTAAIVAGVVLLLVSVGVAMRWPNAWLRSGPSDATRFDDSPGGAQLGPLSDEYVHAQSQRGHTGGVRAPAVDRPAGVLGPASAPGAKAEAEPAAYPAAEACSVDNAGMLPGETRRCRFSATKAGGWYFDYGPEAGMDWPRASVTVTRGETSTTYTQDFAAPGQPGELPAFRNDGCGEGIIEPGDLVDVELTLGSSEASVGTVLGAGYGWDCSPRATGSRNPGS